MCMSINPQNIFGGKNICSTNVTHNVICQNRSYSLVPYRIASHRKTIRVDEKGICEGILLFLWLLQNVMREALSVIRLSAAAVCLTHGSVMDTQTALVVRTSNSRYVVCMKPFTQ